LSVPAPVWSGDRESNEALAARLTISTLVSPSCPVDRNIAPQQPLHRAAGAENQSPPEDSVNRPAMAGIR
jgi:hypothetical protein